MHILIPHCNLTQTIFFLGHQGPQRVSQGGRLRWAESAAPLFQAKETYSFTRF